MYPSRVCNCSLLHSIFYCRQSLSGVARTLALGRGVRRLLWSSTLSYCRVHRSAVGTSSPPPCGPQPGAGSGASGASMPAGRGMAASGSGGGPAADGAPCPPMTSAGSTTRCHLRHTASASPRRTACDTAMRTSGAKRGTAHVAQSSDDPSHQWFEDLHYYRLYSH